MLIQRCGYRLSLCLGLIFLLLVPRQATIAATPQGVRAAKGGESKPETALFGAAIFTPNRQVRRDITLVMAGAALSAKGAENRPVPESPGVFVFGKTISGSPEETAAAFLGLPYRSDGAINEKGEYTLFADQQASFSSPGLNCSGLVVAASRLLLGVNFTLDEVTRDRLGDSGPDAPNGQDWDFGWDLILNISEGFSRCLLLPGFAEADPVEGTGLWPRGYDIHLPETWRELPERLRPGHLYLISLNMEGRGKAKGLRHYHVGFIHVAGSGEAWFYQTTGNGGGVNRRDLKRPEGIASFKKAFANSGNNRKMMLVLEVPLP